MEENKIENLDDDKVESLDDNTSPVESLTEESKVESLDDNKTESLEVAETKPEESTHEEPVPVTEEVKEEVKEEAKPAEPQKEVKVEQKEKPKKQTDVKGIILIVVLLIIFFAVAYVLFGKDIFAQKNNTNEEEQNQYVDVNVEDENEDKPDTSIDEKEQKDIANPDVVNRLETIMNAFIGNKSNSMYTITFGVDRLLNKQKIDIVMNCMEFQSVKKDDVEYKIKSMIDDYAFENDTVVKLNFEEFEKKYELVMGEKPKFDESKIRNAITCPSLSVFDADSKNMYFIKNCSNSYSPDTKISVTQYKEGAEYYYVYTNVTNFDNTYKLMWKFDKNYKFLKTLMINE